MKNKSPKNRKNRRFRLFNRYAIRAEVDSFVAAFIFIALIFFSTYLMYVKSIDALTEEIKIGLKSNALAAATTINGDIHKIINHDSTITRDSSLYISQIRPLEKIRQASQNIRYIYTNILIDDKVYFMLNPSPQNDNDGDNIPDLPPALMDEYSDPAPELLKALKEQKSIVSDVYQDEWGIFISSYAPFYDSNGQFVGTLGMDLELNNFYKRLQPIKIAFEKTVIIIIFIGFIIGLLIWYIRAHTQSLLVAKDKKHALLRLAKISLNKEHQENISILTRIHCTIDNYIHDYNKLKAFNSETITHIILYQQSKINNSTKNTENFKFEDLVNEVRKWSFSKQVKLNIDKDKSIPELVAGESIFLYAGLIGEILSFTQHVTQSDELQVAIHLKEERVDDITVGLKISAPICPDFNAIFNKKLHPQLNLHDGPFGDKEYRLIIAINLLKQSNVKTTSFSNINNVGLQLDMTLLKHLPK